MPAFSLPTISEKELADRLAWHDPSAIRRARPFVEVDGERVKDLHSDLLLELVEDLLKSNTPVPVVLWVIQWLQPTEFEQASIKSF